MGKDKDTKVAGRYKSRADYDSAVSGYNIKKDAWDRAQADMVETNYSSSMEKYAKNKATQTKQEAVYNDAHKAGYKRTYKDESYRDEDGTYYVSDKDLESEEYIPYDKSKSSHKSYESEDYQPSYISKSGFPVYRKPVSNIEPDKGIPLEYEEKAPVEFNDKPFYVKNMSTSGRGDSYSEYKMHNGKFSSIGSVPFYLVDEESSDYDVYQTRPFEFGGDLTEERPVVGSGLTDEQLALRDTGYRKGMIEMMMKEKGGTSEQYEDLMNKIAYRESKYIKDGEKDYTYMDTASVQQGGGPGRGLYMFEMNNKVGEDGKMLPGGGITAANRLSNYLTRNELDVPSWIIDAQATGDLDASTLTKDQQDMLFLANYREHPDANYSNVMDGTESTTDFWSKYHQTSQDPEKEANFKADVESYGKYKAAS